MADVKFWLCNHCGNLFYTVVDGNVTPKCCGEDMQLLVANSTDAAGEKHVPVVTVEGNHVVVNVGEVNHPMLAEHSIEWVALVGNDGNVQIKYLQPGQEPNVKFCAKDIDGGTVYSWCNLHGLWKTEFAK